MKRILFLIAFTFAICLTVQNTVHAQSLLYTGYMGPDTVNAAETIYHYPNGTSFATARRFRELGDLEVTVQLDSLSGATNVDLTLQAAYDIAGTIWYDVGTANLTSGSNTTGRFYHVEDTLFGGTWWRIKAVGTGVQATKFRTVYSFKKSL